MFYNVINIKDVANANEKFEKVTLLENSESCVSVISLKKDEIIDTHTSKADAMVYLIDGEVELHFDAQQFKLKKGEMLMFKKDAQHKVLANKDSKFFLVKI